MGDTILVMSIQLPVGPNHVTLVDPEWAVKFQRCLRPQIHKRARKVYAVVYDGERVTAIHRIITGAQKGQVVDHINGDTLDNRRVNLRVCTVGQNRANSWKDKDNRSGFKGVAWSPTSRKWMGQIVCKGVKHYVGVFVDPVECAKAVDQKSVELHGEFANLNFPA